MTEITSAMSLFVSTLLSRGLGGQELAEVIALAQAAFAGDAKSSGTEAVRREKERLKKERWRARKSLVVHGTVHGTAEIGPLTISNNKTDSSKKERKSNSKNVHGTKVDKPKRDKGQILPADWAPKPSHYEKGTQLGFDRTKVDFFADRMRNWAGANAHRAVARKSNWDLAFHNWLSDKAERNGGSNGKASHALGGFSGLSERLKRTTSDDDLWPVVDAGGFQSTD